MKLREVLAGAPLREALTSALAETEVAGLEYDSRRVGKGFVFFAFAGSRTDGRQFAQDALGLGALA
ncbi:MAG: Mur ligase domain-containing protein, partial [Bryobacteraceae bacterium]